MNEITLNWEPSQFNTVKPMVWTTELETYGRKYTARIEYEWWKNRTDIFKVMYLDFNGGEHLGLKDKEYLTLKEAQAAVLDVVQRNVNMFAEHNAMIEGRLTTAKERAEILRTFLNEIRFPYAVRMHATGPDSWTEITAWIMVSNEDANFQAHNMYSTLMDCAGPRGFDLNKVKFMNGSAQEYDEAMTATKHALDLEGVLAYIPQVFAEMQAEYTPDPEFVEQFEQYKAQILAENTEPVEPASEQRDLATEDLVESDLADDRSQPITFDALWAIFGPK